MITPEEKDFDAHARFQVSCSARLRSYHPRRQKMSSWLVTRMRRKRSGAVFLVEALAVTRVEATAPPRTASAALLRQDP